MKISKNNKKIIIFGAVLLAIILALYIFNLQKYKTNCKSLENIDKIELETRLRELSDKNEQLAKQIENDAIAVQDAQNQINQYKVKCPNCTYHLSTNWEN
jgi:DNA-directed RNA polymerase subunit M/transcription elongation factor TFIIS